MAAMDFSQSQIQSQVQVLSQKQIQSLELLSLASADLRESVFRAVEENPALVITGDSFARGVDLKQGGAFRDGTRTSSRVSSAASLASDNFTAALEAHADKRQSLQEHLLSQFRVLPLSALELALGENLIRNLDSRGFHVLSPVTFLTNGRKNYEKNQALLKKVMEIIQSLDPVGTCTSSTEESLLVQARLRGNASDFTLFILDGHLDFLDPPKADRVLLKFKMFKKEKEKLFGLSEKDQHYLSLTPDEEEVEKTLSFIRTLDPYPARDYSTLETHYVSADISVEKIEDLPDSADEKDGIILTPNGAWLVKNERGVLPGIALNPEFLSLESNEDKKTLASKDELKVVSQSLSKARDFIEALNFRENTVFRAVCRIVSHQSEFFKKGPGYLSVLKQQDIAEELGVHESTISRMANGKYLQCEWGLFELKYFFTAASLGDQSRDRVMRMIGEILLEHKNDSKKLSDQKITDLLNERGVQVARRTVAKYRSLLNIDSSFTR